jgi:hypothetical protein
MNTDAKSILENCRNMFGDPLSHSIKKRIKRFLANPCADTWDDIHGVIIKPIGTTIWNAVLEMNPDFPRTGRAVDLNGNIIRKWTQIPTPFQVLLAIKRSTEL